MAHSGTPAVEITNLDKTYPGASGAALSGVSLSVDTGEIVVLLGLSGSGKSTLLRHINGLEVPSSGAVRSLGEDISTLSKSALRRLRGRIGFIFQQFELVGPLTVLENVLTGSLSTLRRPRLGTWSYPKALRLRALEHLDRVGLLDQAYQRADTLSGGQQQRVAIARALMQEPDILLADEPVASLDPESSSQVMSLIREIAAERGLTVVCSLHQVDLALNWGDRIVGLRGGEVVLDTSTEWLSREEVMEIYGRVAVTTQEMHAINNELADEVAQVKEQLAEALPGYHQHNQRGGHTVTTVSTFSKPQLSSERLRSIAHPSPRVSTVVSYGVIVALALLGVWSFFALDYSLKSIEATAGNLSRFLGMATPMQWPGWEVIGTRLSDGPTTYETSWVGFEPILATLGSIAITLALVFAGTAIAGLLSIPVAYGAARNTSPGQAMIALCRGIGVTLRAIPDIVFVVFFAILWFGSGTLPAIIAIGVHSVGMISKMFADAIEHIDEGPRLAIRAAGGSKAQEFWSGILPQVLPAWVAVTLHRADINLRGTVILGVVGVAGLGYDLDGALHGGPAGMRRVIPIVVIIIVLCMLFEIVSSAVRARLLGVRPTGKGTGDTVVRALARRSSTFANAIDSKNEASERNARIEASLHRPWTKDRVKTNFWAWITVAIVIASFIYAAPNLAPVFADWRWDQLSNPAIDRALWPPNFGSRDWATVLAAVGTTLQVAFAATLMGAIISAIVGPLSASNVASNSGVRNFFRGVSLFLRAVPDLVVAILFIIATGFGPQAAALALGIGGVGLLAKLIGDSMEEVPNGPERAISAVGGTRTQVFFSSTLPMSIPALVSHLMYLLEQNVRAATLLGIVGAGGIGFLLINALQGRHFDQVTAYVLVIIAMVVVVETASILIRKALK